MRKDWLMAAGLGIVVVACFEVDDKDEDEDEDEDEDSSDGGGSGGGLGGGSGSGSGGSGGGGGSLEALAEAVCNAYDDCGLVEDYFGSYEDCVSSFTSSWDSYGYCPGSTISACISTINSMGCDYLYGEGYYSDCYYAIEYCE